MELDDLFNGHSHGGEDGDGGDEGAGVRLHVRVADGLQPPLTGTKIEEKAIIHKSKNIQFQTPMHGTDPAN